MDRASINMPSRQLHVQSTLPIKVESVGTEEIASTYEGLNTIEYKEKRT